VRCIGTSALLTGGRDRPHATGPLPKEGGPAPSKRSDCQVGIRALRRRLPETRGGHCRSRRAGTRTLCARPGSRRTLAAPPFDAFKRGSARPASQRFRPSGLRQSRRFPSGSARLSCRCCALRRSLLRGRLRCQHVQAGEPLTDSNSIISAPVRGPSVAGGRGATWGRLSGRWAASWSGAR
jgi:hypothetical protein